MTFWGGVARFFRLPRARFNSESAPRPIDQIILEMNGLSGGRIGRPAALSVPAVLRGRNMICSISTLPLVQTNAAGAVQRNPFLEQIDPDVANIVTLAQTAEDLLCESVAWWLITQQDPAGFPVRARHVDPSLVSLDPPTGGASNSSPLPSRLDPRGIPYVWVEGVQTPADRVIRFDSPNPPLLTAGAKAIRRALLLDKAAGMYAEDPRPLDYFTPADGADEVDDDEVDGIIAKWRAARKRRSTAWVPAALKYNTVDTPSPQQLQLVELQARASLDIANALGVDPEDLGISTTSRTYANVVDRRQDRINEVLSPYMLAITQRLSMGDVTRRGHVVKFDLQDYLKANPVDRANIDKTYHDMNVMTDDEVRAGRGLPPLTDAQRRELEPPPPPPPVAPPLVDPAAEVDQIDAVSEEWRQMMTGKRATFSSFEAVTLDVPVRGFAVDRNRRIVEGLILPYGPDKIAYKYGMGFRFRPGSLRWTSVNRVKLLRDHDMTQLLGVATDLTETAEGLRARFKVARGAEGDRALSLAEDGVLDGFSVGVDFAEGDMALAEDGVYDVSGADLRETSLTAMPAFDDARLTKVVASRGGEMAPNTAPAAPAQPAAVPDTNPPVQPAQQGGINLSDDQVRALLSRPGALQALAAPAAPVQQQPAQPAGFTLSAEQLDALIASGQIGALLGLPGGRPAQPDPADARQVVDPTRRTAAMTARVDEAAPYRFDRRGNLLRGPRYDFSTDLIAGLRNRDGESYSRALRFIQEQFAGMTAANATRAEFDVDTADVTALNPARQRPDMWVDQLDYTTPLWDFVNRGTLGDATPFIVPKFSSSSGLVGDHTQGTEPTGGTYVATTQTITPSALSGKAEVTREAWNQGGNPQLSSLLWAQMVREWFEDLEAATATFLNTLTAAVDIALPTGAQDDVLDQAWSSEMAGLQFVRGGHRFRAFAVHVDLYKAFAAATDADGRRLYPIIGATNAIGTAAPRWGTLDLGGVTGVPSWGLGATSTNSSNSWLFNPTDVHGWASAPERLDFEYQVKQVEIGIWGYKAFANTRIDGVRQVTYDPTV